MQFSKKLLLFLLKRLFLFFAINVLVVVTLSALLSFSGLLSYLSKFGFGLSVLALVCLIWGIGGALISLALSRTVARRLMRVQTIDPQKGSAVHLQLFQTVKRLSCDAGLSSTPQVGVFHSSEMNAFATGPSQKRALVAVSTALLENMESSEVEAVLGHEISHIANGDMVTMTLMQGVVNAFVMFLSNILYYSLCLSIARNRPLARVAIYLVTLLFELLFMGLGWILISFFSRWREFRADRGGAALSSKEKMISALKRLKENARVTQHQRAECAALNAMMISRPKKSALFDLFSTHPSLDRRIQRLEERI